MTWQAIIVKLIEANTPAALVAEVAAELARAQAERNLLESRRATERNRQQLKRQRDEMSRDVTLCHVTARDNTVQDVTIPSPSPCPPVPPSFPQTPLLPPLTPQTSSPTTNQQGARAKSKNLGVSLEELAVDHIAIWLARKRTEGKYRDHDEYRIVEIFKDFCKSTGKKYEDYVAALRNAFDWDRCQPAKLANTGGSKAQSAREALVRGLTNPGGY